MSKSSLNCGYLDLWCLFIKKVLNDSQEVFLVGIMRKVIISSSLFFLPQNEAKTPSEEGKNFDDSLMSASMTDSMISSLAAASEDQSESATPSTEEKQDGSECPKPSAPESSQPQPPAASQTVTAIDSTSTKGQDVSLVAVTQSSVVEDIVSGVSSVKIEEPHVNGDSPVPMETTPTHTVDLLGTLSDVNSVNLNGVDNSTSPQTSQG